MKVYDIIDKVYKLIGRPIDDIDTLLSNCDDKVWDIYAKGLTTTINQSDSDLGKQLLKRYKPKSLAEMSAWVAAIRPGFASLLNTFLDREPYSTGVKALDDILEDSFHFLLYQESIMKYLVWLGIEEKGTYDIIKKIAKKKFSETELNELHTKLEEGWIKKLGTNDGFAETWQVVQDAARYSFNASHSLSVAIDSLYGAYLKSHYPLEYYTVALSLYSDDIDRTSKLISEMPYFGISLKPIKFGKSGSGYTMDRETNSIYRGVSSVKYLNSSVADELLEVSKNDYDTFIDLLYDIHEKTSINSRQLEILTKLNFFSCFGNNKKLLSEIEIFNNISKCKIISKKKAEQFGISEYLMKKYSERETQSQYRGIDTFGLINELCARLDDEHIGVVEQVKADVEYLGSTTYANEKVAEDYYIVVSYNDSYCSTRPKCVLHCLHDGREISVRIKTSSVFVDNPFGLYSVIKMPNITYEYKKKKVDNKWVDSDELEIIMCEYSVIK